MTEPTPTALERIITHTGAIFRVESLLVRDTDGTMRRRDVVRHPGAVCVVAELDDARLVMIRNQRIAVGQRLLEFCAGKLEKGEDPAVAAGRELEEECGFAAEKVEKLGTFYTSPGFTDELMHVFRATTLRPIPTRLEPGEMIEVEVVAVSAMPELVRSGELIDGKSIAAWALWLAARGQEAQAARR